MRSPAADAFSLLAYRALKVAGLLAAEGDRLSKPSGQSSARWQVLAAVEHEPSTVAAVARALGLARQSVQRVADLLARDELTAYEDNPGHARAKLLRITDHGREALQAIQAAQASWSNRVALGFHERDLRAASETLGQVIAALEHGATPPVERQ